MCLTRRVQPSRTHQNKPMILNTSYNNKETRRKIDDLLGKPFTLRERIKRKGIGSPHMPISQASIQIDNLLKLDNNRNVCNIEMRPNGIILGFRSLLESYGLIITYYKLVLFKGEAETYSVHMDSYRVAITARIKDKSIHKFMKKLMEAKASYDASVAGPI